MRLHIVFKDIEPNNVPRVRERRKIKQAYSGPAAVMAIIVLHGAIYAPRIQIYCITIARGVDGNLIEDLVKLGNCVGIPVYFYARIALRLIGPIA
jgi:hypothetical protein